MGSPNITAVIADGQYRLAQYGQWDGRARGQGLTALRFCRAHLTTQQGRERFGEQLKLVRFVDEEEYDRLWDSIGADDDDVAKGYPGLGLVSEATADRFNGRWPYFSRDHGARILELVWNATGEVLTRNALEFDEDFWCVWGCTVDLDRGTLSGIGGMLDAPTFSLDCLPSDSEFLRAWGEEEEET